MDKEHDSTLESTVSAVSRGQNQLHVLAEDWQAAAAAVQPWLERLEPEAAGPQLLVVSSDAEAATGIAGAISAMAIERGLRTVAATDLRRASRVLRAAPVHVAVGTAGTLIQLIQTAVLKLETVRVVALAWVEEPADSRNAALEALMTELPKDAPRLVLAASVTPVVEELVERYARRARRMQPAASEPASPVSLSYVASAESGRTATLRRLLDTLDPESAFVVTRTDPSRRDVDALLRSLGYGDASSAVRAGAAPPADTTMQLIVLYDLPADESALRRLVSGQTGSRVVALLAPRQVGAVRRIAGGAVTPLALPEAAARARTREDALRDELRAVLAAGHYSRELLALEPLLSDYDGSEIAAAALRLLEADRAARPQSVPATPSAPPPMTRLYVNIGEMDNVRPADLVGAIMNEAGIARSELGRVEVRERHSTVEVATPVANAVVAKLTGVTIRGRRALVKVDEERAGGGRDRGPRRDGGGGRGPRDGKGPRTRPTRERPPRERPPRE